MSRRGEFDVIVVGAGAVGGALALALARDGFEVALVEAREPKPWRAEDEVDLRVVALAPDARALLDDLGAWAAIAAARIGPYRHMHVWDALAPGELHFDAAEQGEAALGWIVENKLVQSMLWRALHEDRLCGSGGSRDAPAANPARSIAASAAPTGVRMHCPGEVADIEDSDSGVTATLADGTRLRARVLVAAEGAESSVRTRLGVPFEGRDYAQRAVVAHVATERPHAGTAWQRFQPGGPLAFLPLADGRCSIVWSLPDAEAARVLALDDDAFRAELGCAFDFRLGAITATTPRAAFPLRLRLAERYVEGRGVLAGDAAHVVHPLAGQGMNLGLRDVACLRRVLRAARERGSDLGAEHVLRRYERERRSDNTLAARGFDAIERVYGSASEPVAALRGAALSLVSGVGALRHVLAARAAGR
ncbi:2-octaprenyl-3-methyl-6-methoxy-1,4-benzoquinol hydroxylase/2-octaprenylphenol hydroxylase [Dokdonella fugitiva]|uniref:2-octaprenyl-3-methyl-6-methoxy-1,4-benzoquinol hydroxylase/2-octaprenylphenol hydroxylase n=1 Tax=Dokdonella fugitiva TaxID=328517 RepID=A0A839EUL9_9GAMM|nr:UbiH/UbiF/VisC/COQ6 family ubiquinone biosynthesis hydroxylase [Dokdonella fugitiva]MBA8888227.1 2-octaprenyl-3-methyl-6-methoxy-1,4-benzoquinol hydroxylase/2-octaprenylphenol hydroxylase [Dokdonella fugitiva]